MFLPALGLSVQYGTEFAWNTARTEARMVGAAGRGTAEGACTGCSQQIAQDEAQVRFPECDKAFHWDCWFDETIANCHRDIEQQEGVNAQLRREMGQLRAQGAGGSSRAGVSLRSAPAPAPDACAGCGKLAAALASTQEDNGIALDFQAQAEARVEQLEAELKSVRQQLRAQQREHAKQSKEHATQRREHATQRREHAKAREEHVALAENYALTGMRAEVARMRAEILDAQQLADLLDELDEAKRVVNLQTRRPAEDLVANTPRLHAFLCPIGLQLMRDPVMAADDHTYERAQIEQWITARGYPGVQSPKTNWVLAHTRLQPNHTVKSLINNAVKDQLREMRKAHDVKKRKRASSPS
jgi:hypothetical protein